MAMQAERGRNGIEAARRRGDWVVPVVEELGSVTEITLQGTECGSDRKQRGSFSCCCAVS